ncbi:hypothetical protein JZ751_020826 [Albula glossodonta]|uniref:Uncharacterized protein n=1 Tax=Albula glossodonta TaxID=121402 RepID=A0A8T2PN46_9TELE|nr:hypothetical protein JZ751_020826 [Albula glossodonta]
MRIGSMGQNDLRLHMKQISSDLEHQYQQSMDDKLSGRNRRHCGLGFSEQDPPAKTDSTTQPDKGASPKSATTTNEQESPKETPSQDSEPDSQKLAATATPDCAVSPKEEKRHSFKVAFVKSS